MEPTDKEILTKAARKGDSEAQYLLGKHYYEKGTRRDHKSAIKWLTLAAEQGHMSAQHDLGMVYFHSDEDHLEESLKW
ncbi:MAG: hypothetical protein LBV63_04145, partial [Candidatus Methanoplasma sp.]|nr:hypothetical protein [Candidatus Methanoplasma sp.]